MPYEALRPLTAMDVEHGGQPLLLIPLANSSGHARISPEDYQTVLSHGYSPNWYIHGEAVTTHRHSSGHSRVSRIILGIAEPGHRSTRVSHANGDKTDLRRCNLTTKKVNEAKRRYGRDDRRPGAPADAGWQT